MAHPRRYTRNYVEAVAGIIYESVEWHEWEDYRTINDSEEGWTVEFNAPLNSVLRVEQVHLTEDELKQAWAIANEWLAGNYA